MDTLRHTQSIEGDLVNLEFLSDRGFDQVLDAYRPAADRLASESGLRIALAAGLVEAALDLQGLGRETPQPAEILAGDLCLARASRLLAETGSQRLQIAFARVVERIAAAAAAGSPLPSTRALLLAAIEAGA